MNICETCGKQFEPNRFARRRTPQRFCSRKCNLKKYRTTEQFKKNAKLYRQLYRQGEYYKKRKREHARELHRLVIEKLGGKCQRCGVIDERILQINHKNGGGSIEFKKVGPFNLYKQILNGKRQTSDLEILCANCNIIHKWEIGIIQ